MATISSLGVGSSGLDVKSIVSQLVELEKAPLTNLKLEAATVNTRISAYGQIKSLVSTLNDASRNLNSLVTYNAVKTTSSNTGAVQATAIGGTIANSFTVKVDSLAKAQSQASGSLLPVGGALGAGTLRLQLGQWTVVPASFTAQSGGAPVDIVVNAADTVETVASKINSAGAGVTATVLNDVSGQRLLLRSSKTGEANGFQVSVLNDADGNDADAAGLSRIVSGASTQHAADAKIQINDIAVSSSTNTFSDVVSGVSLTVAQETTTPVEVAVTADKSPVTAAVNAFVEAYNALNDQLNDLTKYDAATKEAGLLQGDSVAVGLQSALRGILQSSTTGSAYKRLADIGITQALGGNLQLDSTKFEAALANGDEVRNLFKASNTDATTNGVALKFKTFTDGLMSATGLFSNKDTALKRSLASNADEQAAVNNKASRLETQLTRRYSALDVQLTNLSALNSYITQQVAQWNKTSSDS